MAARTFGERKLTAGFKCWSRPSLAARANSASGSTLPLAGSRKKVLPYLTINLSKAHCPHSSTSINILHHRRHCGWIISHLSGQTSSHASTHAPTVNGLLPPTNTSNTPTNCFLFSTDCSARHKAPTASAVARLTYHAESRAPFVMAI